MDREKIEQYIREELKKFDDIKPYAERFDKKFKDLLNCEVSFLLDKNLVEDQVFSIVINTLFSSIKQLAEIEGCPFPKSAAGGLLNSYLNVENK